MFLFLILLISCWVAAASFMAEKTNAWMAVYIADITSMCGFGSDGPAALLSACSFVCCCSHQFLFPCLDVLFQSTPPLRAISRKALPGHSVDIDSLRVSYADIIVSQARAACGSSAQSQIVLEDVFWNATILHTADMTQPSQSALSKQSVHTGKTSTSQDITVGYSVLPGYSQDTVDASQVEWVEHFLLPGIRSPCLAAIPQCADNAGIVFHRQRYAGSFVANVATLSLASRGGDASLFSSINISQNYCILL